ncbi:MAG TPA: phosphodiester glycosidase family protein [Polyangia bacterium]|nr:phosphodiester glycosidase family protein [Polyangia bacterium]
MAAGAWLAWGWLLATSPAAPQKDAGFRTLEPGLELGVFNGPTGAVGDRRIYIVRIDLAHFTLKLLNASAPGEGRIHTAREWCARAGAQAGINASMFRDDGRSVAMMRTRTHVNHPTLSRDQSVLAFDRLQPGHPDAMLIDRECDDLGALGRAYGTLVQSIRMLSCRRANRWTPSPRRWSTAAIGTDGRGRVLFIHARSPWPVHHLIQALIALPIDLRRAMYVEGGPEAQLYVHAGTEELERVGSFETGFNENDDNARAWAIPNVVVAVRR